MKRRTKMSRQIRRLAMLVSAICILALSLASAGPVRAADGLSVDVHTQDEIRAMYQQLNLQEDLPNTFEEEPSNQIPYRIGKVSQATLQNGLNTLNFFRYVAGIPYNVQIKDEYQQLTQSAALLMAVNKEMTHSPAQPETMGEGSGYESLYHAGHEGASSSNIGAGYHNLYQAIVFGWMSDDDPGNIKAVGHRRWCLNPTMQYTGFGIDNGYYAMYALDRTFKPTSYKGVAWPAQNTPEGFFRDEDPWSISMDSVLSKSGVVVTLKRVNDGRTWTFSDGSADFYVDNGGYGQTGCIIFRPQGVGGYHDGDKFQVSITGSGLNVSYEVNFFSLHTHTGGTATCQKRAVCSICGKEYGELGPHQYTVQPETPATCTEAGQRVQVCAVCGDKKTEATEPALGHAWNTDYTVDTPATCQQKGSRSIHCSRCGAIKENTVEEIPQTGHNWGAWKTTKEPTYTKEGVQQRTCSVCGTVEKSSLEKKDFEQVSVSLKGAVSTRYNRVKITWSPVSGVGGYRIFRQREGGSWRSIKTISKAGVKAYTDKTVVPNTLYSYRIRPFIKEGGRTRWGVYSEVVTAETSLAQGIILRIDSRPGKNVLRMRKVAGATGYEIWCQVGDGSYEKVADTKRVMFTHKGRQSGTTYYYKVRPYRKLSGGKTVYGEWSAVEFIKTK